MHRPEKEVIADVLVTSAIKLPRVLRALDERSVLTVTEASAMAVLMHAGPMNIGSLARFEQVKAPSMTRTISNLEARGLVVRVADHVDARGWIIEVTQKGRRVFRDGHQRKMAPLQQWLENLSDRDFYKLVQALPIIEAMGELTLPSVE